MLACESLRGVLALQGYIPFSAEATSALLPPLSTCVQVPCIILKLSATFGLYFPANL